MKKFFCVTLCAFLVGGAVFAAGGKDLKTVNETGSKVVKIALIVESTIDDKGWAQAMHDGILDAQKQLPGRIEYSYSEKQLPVDAGSSARQYVSQGYHIIIAHGAQFKNLCLEMAEEFPKTVFAFGTSAEVGPANVFTYMPESEETGYINGIIAGLTTKNNIIGYVGPVDGGDSARYGRGFILGVKAVNPTARILVAHSGSFSDMVKAGEVAQSQIRTNADILTGASQQALGALRAVGDSQYASRNLWWVGQDIAQIGTNEGKAKCLAASSYNYTAVIVGLVQKLDAGVRGGECIPMNFNNNGFVFTYNDALSSQVSADTKAKVTAALAQLKAKAGTIDWQSVDYAKL
jgi:basic membrane protein A